MSPNVSQSLSIGFSELIASELLSDDVTQILQNICDFLSDEQQSLGTFCEESEAKEMMVLRKYINSALMSELERISSGTAD